MLDNEITVASAVSPTMVNEIKVALHKAGIGIDSTDATIEEAITKGIKNHRKQLEKQSGCIPSQN